jgi:hypothetical protein
MKKFPYIKLMVVGFTIGLLPSCETTNTTGIGDVGYTSPRRVNSAQQSGSIYEEMDRVRSIRDPNERANANLNFIKGLVQMNNQVIENNPQAFGGMSADEAWKESAYQKAREGGLSPSEAQIEAERSYQNMKRFMQ